MGSPQQFIIGCKMKWTLCLLCVASVATALPAKEPKAFSLFSVVTFPNLECTTDTTPAMTGICVTAEECSNDGDVIAQAQGNCASGFGVCCLRRVEGNPNGAITSGLTYVQSPQFPQAVTALNPAAGGAVAAVNRAFNIMGGPNVCQIRFDFVTAVVNAPNAAGTCNTDVISIQTTGRTAPQASGHTALCGTLTNQHLIVDVQRGTNAMAATLNINTAAAASARMWNILVKCVECDSDDLAPPGCRQYFTDASGRFTSFNGAREVAGGAHNMPTDAEYSICFRQIPGFCGVRLTQTRDSPGDAPDSFKLTEGTAAATSINGAGCASHFIRVPEATLTANAAGVITPVLPRKVCGQILNSESGATASGAVDNCGFRITVSADVGTANGGATTGFDLKYQQIPCPCS